MMTDPRPIAIARTFAELVDGMAALIAERKVDHLSLDAAAGLAEGHTGKIMCGSKGYGPQSFDAHLAALGGCIVIAIDPEREPRITSSIKRKAPDATSRLALRRRTREGRELIREMLVINSKKGRGKISAGKLKKQTKAERRRIAKLAAKARWRKPKITELRGKAAEKVRKQLTTVMGEVDVGSDEKT